MVAVDGRHHAAQVSIDFMFCASNCCNLKFMQRVCEFPDSDLFRSKPIIIINNNIAGLSLHVIRVYVGVFNVQNVYFKIM